MGQLSVKRFSAPDERRPFVDRGFAEVLGFEGGAVGRGVFEPGWRWSAHVKPIAQTDSCQASHACYVLSGRMHIKMDDGSEADMGPGDVAIIPPGHDAWTVGDVACIALDFAGMEHYATRPAQPAEQDEVTPVTAH
jgi:quercetin dioxygenase-like cupin family protein